MIHPNELVAVGGRLDRHHPVLTERLASCARCGSETDGQGEHHLPTEFSVKIVEGLLDCYPWPTAHERAVHSAIRRAAERDGFPVRLDAIVEELAPGYSKWVQENGFTLEALTPSIAFIIGAEGRYGRLKIDEIPTGHHVVHAIILPADDGAPIS